MRMIHSKSVNSGIGVLTVMVGGRKERGVHVVQLLSKFALTVDFFRLMTLTHPDSRGHCFILYSTLSDSCISCTVYKDDVLVVSP